MQTDNVTQTHWKDSVNNAINKEALGKIRHGRHLVNDFNIALGHHYS